MLTLFKIKRYTVTLITSFTIILLFGCSKKSNTTTQPVVKDATGNWILNGTLQFQRDSAFYRTVITGTDTTIQLVDSVIDSSGIISNLKMSISGKSGSFITLDNLYNTMPGWYITDSTLTLLFDTTISNDYIYRLDNEFGHQGIGNFTYLGYFIQGDSINLSFDYGWFGFGKNGRSDDITLTGRRQ
jgi:hypothetical protein